eukprot:scaffold230528_cov22-Tisochrysis_lutea.AAC.1
MDPASAARTPPAPTLADLETAALSLSASPADAGVPAAPPDTPFPADALHELDATRYTRGPEALTANRAPRPSPSPARLKSRS